MVSLFLALHATLLLLPYSKAMLSTSQSESDADGVLLIVSLTMQPIELPRPILNIVLLNYLLLFLIHLKLKLLTQFPSQMT